MRRLSVRYRKSAAGDLAEIGYYLRAKGLSAKLADAYVDRIRAACERTGDAPEGGTLRDDLWPELRTWSFERKALIAYVVDPRGVRIVNVFHRGRDVAAHYASQRKASGLA